MSEIIIGIAVGTAVALIGQPALLQPIMAYYATLTPVNMLSGNFGTPTPVPIIEAKQAIQRAQNMADELIPRLQQVN